MKAREFTGVIPPLLSSFEPGGAIHEQGLRAVVRFTLPHVDGYYPIGTYGCGPLMCEDERKRALEVILKEVNGKVPVVAHVGAAGTASMLDLARHAKSAGASGVGAIAPYYAPNLPEENLYRHFAALVDAVNEVEFPVFVYNNAHYSQNRVTPKLLRRLAEHGLRGCKDSSFDLVNFFMFQDAVADYSDFNVIVGTEAFFMAAFDAGATGMICGMGNVVPDLLARMYKAYLAGRRDEAMEAQRLILRLREITKSAPTVPVLHAILRARGIDAGYPRSPYIDLDQGSQKSIVERVRQLGLLE